MKPFLLEPIHDYTIWGTNHISKARGIDEDYGTWWEVSAHPYCSNKIIGTNKTLMEMIQENPDELECLKHPLCLDKPIVMFHEA